MKAVALTTLAAIAILCGALVAGNAFPPPLSRPDVSTVVTDADGALLRAFTVDGGRWRLPLTLAEVDPRFITLLVAYEDQRFFRHHGVDPWAGARALAQAIGAQRIVSGASTLTMQTVRLLTRQRQRTALRKVVEAVRAVQMEQRLSKAEILERYLVAAPYGGNIEGLRAASLAYFGREPQRLTLAQIALLIALPQSPETRRPDRHPEAAERARNLVLDALAARGAITDAEARRAKREAIPTKRRAVPRLAPHLGRRLVRAAPHIRHHTTTLSRDMQATLERLVAARVDHIGPKVSAAIVVAEHGSGAIRASVGAARFLDAARAGHVDMTTALRSPGSTLKPFIYGLGIEAGLVARGTLMDDTRHTFDGYEPENFDDEFRGMVTVDEALRQSLNVPAVTLLDAIGAVQLAVRLQGAGATVVLPQGDRPTLAMGLGGFGTRLVDLAGLYGALARGGAPVSLYTQDLQGGAPAGTPHARLLSERAAREVAAILAGMRPPRNAPPGEIAYKTGTSYGHRDAWAIGFDAAHVIAVWVGRPDGTPVPQLTGWTDAAPLLFDAFARIGVHRRHTPPAPIPTADLPPPLRMFAPGRGGRRKPRSPITGAVSRGLSRDPAGHDVAVAVRPRGAKPLPPLTAFSSGGRSAFPSLLRKDEGGTMGRHHPIWGVSLGSPESL